MDGSKRSSTKIEQGVDRHRQSSQSVSQSVVRTIGVLAPAQVIFQEEDSRQLVKLVDIYLC